MFVVVTLTFYVGMKQITNDKKKKREKRRKKNYEDEEEIFEIKK